MPKVAVRVTPGASGNGKLSLRCDVAERRVAVERGEGASRKIQFTSTFDAVVDASAADDVRALYDGALAPAVAAVAGEGREHARVCSDGAAKRRPPRRRRAARAARPPHRRRGRAPRCA